MKMDEPKVKFEAFNLSENIFTTSDCSNSEFFSGIEMCSCTNSAVDTAVGGDCNGNSVI